MAIGPKETVVRSRHKDAIANHLGDDILRWLSEPDTTDVICNPPLPGEENCRIWVARLGRDREPVGTMAPDQAMQLICAVAGSMGRAATPDSPSVEGVLLTDGSRFQGLIPPVVAAPFFAIRRPASAVFPLSAYVASGRMTETQKAIIEDAVLRRLNILICGGTGSGKTTLLNAVTLAMAELTPHHRFFFIEDTAELKCEAPDRTMTLTSRTMTIRDLLRSAMRSFPDRIIIGETRGPEMLDILTAWRTGHEGGAATIHSNVASPTDALERVEDLLLQANPNPMQRMIAKTINLIVCVAMEHGQRKVAQVAEVTGWDGHHYLIKEMDQ
jgi:type IV secretion system protein VirB11